MYFNAFRALPLGVLLLASQIAAQSIISVQVGDNGQFYTPNNIPIAPKGTVINFQFVGSAHSVVQASYSAPCQPLDGGFDSGVTGLKVVSDSSLAHPVQWNLTVTDDTMPIWFYCKAHEPQPHCQHGMVGVINPPTESNQTFQSYMDASMASTVASQRNGSSLVGIGASASSAPFLPPLPSKVNTGAIVGGIFGGLALIIVLGGLFLLLMQSKKKAQRLEAEQLAMDGSSWLARPALHQGWNKA